MFATLAGAFPSGDPGQPLEVRLREVVADQVAAGLGLLTDGWIDRPDPVEWVGRRLLGDRSTPRRERPMTVDSWLAAQELAGEAIVKQCLPGPYTLGRRLAGPADRAAATVAIADELAGELAELAASGCPFIQVDEDDAVAIGEDPAAQALFVEAHLHLLAHLAPPGRRPHLSLAISGGNADRAGPETIFAPAYDSYLFDLIAGPDNWRLVTRAPIERGIILGVVDARSAALDDPSLVVWAVGYAASTGRGHERIGIAPSGGLAGLSREAARAKIDLLGEVVRLIERRDEEAIAAALDPRAVDARSAGLGRWSGRRGRRPGPG